MQQRRRIIFPFGSSRVTTSVGLCTGTRQRVGAADKLERGRLQPCAAADPPICLSKAATAGATLHNAYGGGAAAISSSWHWPESQSDRQHGQLDVTPWAALQQLTGLTSLALRGEDFALVSSKVIKI
jgi:hypothetical protein